MATNLFVGIQVYLISDLVSGILVGLPGCFQVPWQCFRGGGATRVLQLFNTIKVWAGSRHRWDGDGSWPLRFQHDPAEADVQKQNAMLESEDAIATCLTKGELRDGNW